MKSKKIGVLGSGQLGQMMALEALPLGFDFYCYSPDPVSPAKKAGVTDFVGEYTDYDSLGKFLEKIDILSFEFENIPGDTLLFLEDYSQKKGLEIFPNPNSLRIAQDRFLEKSHFSKLGLNTPKNHHLIKDNANDKVSIPFPWIVKTLRFGYDGKGQTKVTNESDYQAFLSQSFPTGKEEYLIEEVISFDLEVSVILCRFQDGNILSYGTIENIHKNHILDVSIFPARIEPTLSEKAVQIASSLADSLNYVGIMGVEFFIRENQIYLNEFAPRPHNSGHFSQNAESCSQFLLHLYAISGLGKPNSFSPKPAVMKNILGNDYRHSLDLCYQLIKDDRYSLHLYGKEEPRAGRKMGHLNFKGEFKDLDPRFFQI